MYNADPTAIAIDVDPRYRRMRGVAVHGDTPFDVPFISEIAPNLWMGGCASGLVLPDHIDFVVSLYPWERYQLNESQRRYEHRMYDSAAGDFNPSEVLQLALMIDTARYEVCVLVHCQAGLNRSGLVMALALMVGGKTADEAIALLREKRSPAVLCNASFEGWLRTKGQELVDARRKGGQL